MNELKVFENNEFGKVRVFEIENKPYFVGKEIAEILGYSNASKAVITHVDDEDKTFIMLDIADSRNGNVLVGQSKTAVINESGLYSLILSSKLPNAKRFKRWVTSEVLPCVRQTGAYMTKETLENVLYNPDLIIGIANQIKTLQTEIAQKNQLIGELQPKANYVDTILNSKNLVTITQIAKDYGMSGKKMNRLLNEFGVQYKQNGQWLLYSEHHQMGYTHSRTINITRSEGRTDAVLDTLWTQKGRLFIYELLKKHDILPLIEQND